MIPDYKTRHKQNKSNATVRNQISKHIGYNNFNIPKGKKAGHPRNRLMLKKGFNRTKDND